MTKFSEDVIGKIKGEHICPRPRWCFLLRSLAFWSLLVISVILGSISFSVIVHLATFGDLNMLGHLRGNPVTSAVMLLPYFWFLSLVVFALVAYFNWKHTKLGYRFKRRWIFVSGIVVSILFGSVLYVLGMGNKIDLMMARAMPFYERSKHSARNEIWLQPDKGLLSGKVMMVDGEQNLIVIRDDQGTDWVVLENQTKISPTLVVKKGQILKIIGTQGSGHEFMAREIRKCGNCQEDEE